MLDLKEIFNQDLPLIDVRSPTEFRDGHFPNASNFPILNDEERHLVGTEYKKVGQDSAIRLGYSLVSGPIKEQRIEAWKQFLLIHPTAKLFCFRGGLRSQISGQWLKEAGVDIEIIPGGYKRLRHFLRTSLEAEILQKKILILGGRTGVGKTQFLNTLPPQKSLGWIDLEALADHRGSAFGGKTDSGHQPSQTTFENSLACAVLKNETTSTLLLEDESRAIGAVEIPPPVFLRMKEAPVLILERPFEERVQTIIHEYVMDQSHETEIFLKNALGRIQKKLGGGNYQEILLLLEQGFISGQHFPWVARLLHDYYDPMYDHYLHRQGRKIIFQGNPFACRDFIARRHFDTT